MSEATTAARETRELDQVTILFCGDSGDGMQLTGSQFTSTSAVVGNDVSTFPDYPSEIRAPAGSLAGVSAYQVCFSSREIHTPGDRPEVLVAMNPAALKVNLSRLVPGGLIIANSDAFDKASLKKAGYTENPLESGELSDGYQVQQVPITTLTIGALENVKLDQKGKQRCKNTFTLGLLYWLYDRPINATLEWTEKKFARTPAVAEANIATLKAGYNYGETTEAFPARFQVPRIIRAAPS